MLLAAFGAPTQFGNIGSKIIEAIVAASSPDSLFLSADDPETIFAELQGRKLQGLGIYSRIPELRLVEGIRRLERRCVVFYDEPAAVFARAMGENGYNLTDSARQASAYVASFVAPLVAHEALVIRNTRHTYLRDVIDLIARHFDLAVDRQEVLERMGCFGMTFLNEADSSVHDCACRLTTFQGRVETPLQSIDESLTDALKLSMPGLDEILPDGVPRPLIWRRNMFYSQDRVLNISRAPDGWQELLGPARFSYVGPYLHLPPGVWDMKAQVRTRGNIAGNKMEFAIYQVHECIAFGHFELPRMGGFEIATTIQNSRPEKYLDFRLRLREGAIDGEIILDEVCWTHRGFAGNAGIQAA